VADDEVVSKIGRVTGRIAPGTIGEVVIPIRGGRETYYGYAFETGDVIEVDTEVIVVEHIGPRSVKVVPFAAEEGAGSPWSQSLSQD
jgi:hypothetical protein